MIFSSPGCSMNEFMLRPSWSPSRTIEGLPPRNSFESVLRAELHLALVPRNAHVRDVIGDVWNGIRGRDACDASDLGGDGFQTALPFFVELFVVFFQIKLKTFDHAHNFFFADFRAATKSVFVRAVV